MLKGYLLQQSVGSKNLLFGDHRSKERTTRNAQRIRAATEWSKPERVWTVDTYALTARPDWESGIRNSAVERSETANKNSPLTSGLR